MNFPRCIKRILLLLLFSVFSLPCVSLGEPEDGRITVEAEKGTLLGNAKVVKQGLYTFVDGLENDGDGVMVQMNVPKSGFYDIVARVKCGSYKENYVEVDGVRVGNIAGTMILWGDVKLERIWFDTGDHTVSILKYWGWTQIDSISLVPSNGIDSNIYDVPATLVNPNATDNAKRLMKWMTDVYGKKIITGQYSDNGMYGDEMNAIYASTGEYPAILGLDLIDYSPSRVARGTRGKSVDKAIEYWNEGGIISFAWHWNAPEEYLSGTWYSAFYTDHTNIDLKKIVNGEDPEGYALLIRDIDAIAVQLKRLKEAGVPILWRPLHEASGGWFWWGAKGADAYISLYRLLYDRLTNVHGLNNLIWVWNGQSADWYPGDEYVDMIGWDIYAGEHAYASQSAVFLEASRVTDKKMMIILSENGTVPDIDFIFRDGTIWGSYATWSGDFVIKNGRLSEQYTEKTILEKMFMDDRAVKRSDLPDFESYPLQ
ncbi:MAG: beta-mannosidase [Clostridia bacterium]|nr:hypothetical protein [Fibrobacter sp.]MBR3928089.1 beta-mannosidase [Clostridia bacterium]